MIKISSNAINLRDLKIIKQTVTITQINYISSILTPSHIFTSNSSRFKVFIISFWGLKVGFDQIITMLHQYFKGKKEAL